MLRIVAATRHDVRSFPQAALLGRTMARLAERKHITFDIAYENAAGLPEVYNAALDRAAGDDEIVFTHDDVLINDWFLPERLAEAFAHFAVVGIAGNRRRVSRQPAWLFIDEHLTWDTWSNMSGAVAHIVNGEEPIHQFGTTPAPAKLLDGVFLAARVEKLRRANVRFDPRFRFHFYDMDFCRNCEKAGVPMGTWPIAITHASAGHFGIPPWRAACAEYFAKWAE